MRLQVWLTHMFWRTSRELPVFEEKHMKEENKTLKQTPES